MIRILHAIGSLEIGGSQSMIVNLYRAIDKTKIQFDFVVHREEYEFYQPIVEALGAKVYTLPTFKGYNIQKVRKAWDRFFCDHPEYKVLHSHVRSYASLYLPIAKKHGLKTIIHSHSTSNGSGLSSVMKMALQYPLRYQADYFFGCSREAGEWLFGKSIVNSDKYKMLQNAINTDTYRFNQLARNECRRELNLGTKKVYIHVGRLHEAKNHMFLLEVFAKIWTKCKDSVLLIVGDGDLKGQIQQKIKELGVESSVQMLGARSDVPNLLQAADCFLFPSKWEGLPVTVVEAQAAGLPCYISETVTKDVKVSELAHYLPIDDPVLWVEAVDDADLSRKDVTEDIIRAGFDVKTTAQQMENFYMELTEND